VARGGVPIDMAEAMCWHPRLREAEPPPPTAMVAATADATYALAPAVVQDVADAADADAASGEGMVLQVMRIADGGGPLAHLGGRAYAQLLAGGQVRIFEARPGRGARMLAALPLDVPCPDTDPPQWLDALCLPDGRVALMWGGADPLTAAVTWCRHAGLRLDAEAPRHGEPAVTLEDVSEDELDAAYTRRLALPTTPQRGGNQVSWATYFVQGSTGNSSSGKCSRGSSGAWLPTSTLRIQEFAEAQLPEGARLAAAWGGASYVVAWYVGTDGRGAAGVLRPLRQEERLADAPCAIEAAVALPPCLPIGAIVSIAPLLPA
jgi:hypothetical protein